MLGIGFWDWAAIGAYLLGITILGVWTMLKVRDTADFFMGGRMHNKWLMLFFSFGAGTSGNDAIGVSAKTYTSGMAGIWYQWLWLFATPFYWLIAPVMRRMRCLTTGDFYAQRYDGSVEGLYSIIGVLQLTFNMGVLLRGGGAMIEAVSGGAIHASYAIVAMTVLFLVYGMAGGLTAAILTDFVQGLLTVVLSFMLLPIALKTVGGLAGLRAEVNNETLFSLVSPGEINTLHIVVLCLSALVGIVTQPHIMGVCAAGRTEFDGRFGFAGGNLLKRFCTIAWMLVGLCGIAMYPGLTAQEADNVYGMVARDLLPNIMPGLVGIFLAALLASIMSSCDAFMVSSSGLFTQNFYRRYVGKGRSERHYVLVGRVSAFVIVAVSMFVAFRIRNVPEGLVWFFKIQALMGPAFWLGLFWRRTTVKAVWIGTLAALVVMYAGASGKTAVLRADLDGDGDMDRFKAAIEEGELPWWENLDRGVAWTEHAAGSLVAADVDGDGDLDIQLAEGQAPGALWLENVDEDAGRRGSESGTVWRVGGQPEAEPLDGAVIQPWFIRHVPSTMIWDGRFRESYSILFYLLTGFGVTMLVSLMTRRVPAAKLDRLYDCIRTPVTGDEPHAEPFTLPDGVEPKAPAKIIDHPDWEIYWPSKVSVIGFVIFWAWVIGLIAFVYWLASIGAPNT